jgi:hypothetical protein
MTRSIGGQCGTFWYLDRTVALIAAISRCSLRRYTHFFIMMDDIGIAWHGVTARRR